MLNENAVWFSRHPMTEAQKAEALEMGYVLLDLADVTRLAGVELADDEDLLDVLNELEILCARVSAAAIFGVFPTPIQNILVETQLIRKDDNRPAPCVFRSCYSSWNVRRTKEGEKPTFEHKDFRLVGHFDSDWRRCFE